MIAFLLQLEGRMAQAKASGSMRLSGKPDQACREGLTFCGLIASIAAGKKHCRRAIMPIAIFTWRGSIRLGAQFASG